MELTEHVKAKQGFTDLLSESGVTCVSIIVPTHRTSPGRIADSKTIIEAVNRTKEYLKHGVSDRAYKDDLAVTVDELVETIDFTHLQEGLGIFVSPRISKLVNFPFPVKEKIKVGDTFDTRDLLYNFQTITDYCVLSISKKRIRLFFAHGEMLQEIKNNDFPLDYEETYEYSKSSRGTSFGNALKGFEKDKTVVQEFRLEGLLRSADHLLNNYLNDTTSLVIVGDNKEISDFLQVTSHKKRVIEKITGNYNFNGEMQLAKLAWTQVKKYLKKQNNILISDLREMQGKDMVAIGIEEVWKAAKEGKGQTLIVEKDLEHTGFINEREYKIRLHKPVDQTNYLFVSDIVERTIKTVRAKKGKIVFVDNGELQEFGGIALSLRYNIFPLE